MTGTDLYKRTHKSVLVIFESPCTWDVKAKSKVHISHKKAKKFFVQNMLAFLSNTTIYNK